MEILLGLLIIAIGAFCQSSCYVPINKIKNWSWESYWIVQGVFAWLVFPLLGALLAVPAGHSLFELFAGADSFRLSMTVLFGVLWGIGGLTFGLSMRYLGVALGQSIALGTCAALGTIMGPVLLNVFFPELDACGGNARRNCHNRCGGSHEICFAFRRREKSCRKGFQFSQGYSHSSACRIYERVFQCGS